jgi:hypothetical protein
MMADSSADTPAENLLNRNLERFSRSGLAELCRRRSGLVVAGDLPGPVYGHRRIPDDGQLKPPVSPSVIRPRQNAVVLSSCYSLVVNNRLTETFKISKF